MVLCLLFELFSCIYCFLLTVSGEVFNGGKIERYR